MELQLFDETKFNQAMKLSETLARSSIVPLHFRGKPADVFSCLVLGSELGFQPMQALNSIVVIQGNATLKAQTMLALVRSRCPKAVIKITTDESRKSATCFVKRDDNDDGYEAFWDFNKAMDAKFAQSWDKDLKKWVIKHNWQVQPTNMAKWRAISEALRVIFPDILQGLYATEEIEDIVIEKSTVQVLNEAAEIDFPIPPEEKEVGPLYRIQNAKFRGKQLYQITTDELQEYLDTLTKRTTVKKSWEIELQKVLTLYLANIDSYRDMILELNAGEE